MPPRLARRLMSIFRVSLSFICTGNAYCATPNNARKRAAELL